MASTDADKRRRRRQAEFYNRLDSFTLPTFFAKPVCLSPIVCAALGYRNTKLDIIKCDYCRVVIHIPKLSSTTTPKSYKQLVLALQERLATTHKPFCTAGMRALRYHKSLLVVEDKEKVDDALTAATNKDSLYESIILTRAFAVLLEDALPTKEIELFQAADAVNNRQVMADVYSQSCTDMVKHIADISSCDKNNDDDGDNDGTRGRSVHPIKLIESCQIPRQVLDYRVDSNTTTTNTGDDATSGDTTTTVTSTATPGSNNYNTAQRLLRTCQQSLTSSTSKIDPHNYAQQVTVVLVLLGWRGRADDADGRALTLQCSICMSKLDFEQPSSRNSVEDDSKTNSAISVHKNVPRQFHLLDAHKYYCPYACVLPGNNMPKKPIWQLLLDCIFAKPNSKSQPFTDVPNWEQVHKQLRSVISPRAASNTSTSSSGGDTVGSNKKRKLASRT